MGTRRPKACVAAMREYRIGVEGRRNPNIKNPHIFVDALSTAEVWKLLGEAFIRPCNIEFIRHFFHKTTQLQNEKVKQFYQKLMRISR